VIFLSHTVFPLHLKIGNGEGNVAIQNEGGQLSMGVWGQLFGHNFGLCNLSIKDNWPQTRHDYLTIQVHLEFKTGHVGFP
jgi:hypothetical protein